MQIASSSMARFHYIFQRSQAETFLHHQDTIFGRLACRLRYRDQGLIFKNDLCRQLQRLSWWNHPLLSAPMQTTDFWTYWRSRVTCDAVDPLEETKKSSPQNVSHLVCPWGPHHLLHPAVRRSSAFPTSTHGYNGLVQEKGWKFMVRIDTLKVFEIGV